ncbi:guanine deaminase [Exilibacterium tricleocarpae]|uniref:Guanine deaminase n=1 Tax=Exilibacterium tricleocarpae TaxID=2591008 RepID=A0A545U9Q6_9GAMM|nr:guanine deaminase [Exilibacterium tricleocarpae]TQV86206.1 guanine deaminase [Exilibacterium tricleocarpae]
MSVRAYRGPLLHFTAAPTSAGEGVEYFADGVLVVDDGRVRQVGPAAAVLAALPADCEVRHHPDHLIMPGFIDTHVHFPQIDVIASYGEQLLDWLNHYTFPAEQRFAEAQYAAAAAERFLDELLRNGTTTALTFCTVHPASVEAFFSASTRRGTRMLAGKVLMDRNAPDGLTDTAAGGIADSERLIEKWHNNGRQSYALTPRFAPTSTPAQLQKTGALLARHSDVYMQTHLSENSAEVQWVETLFPERTSYLDVYDHYGLLSERSVFAHGIHLRDRELRRLAETGASIAFCPTSNLFLGSGLLDLQRLQDFGVTFSLATDVGAGTSFSQLQTLNEAYKVAQLKGYPLHPYEAFYRLTLGNARSLHLDHCIGNFEAGKEADFVVLDPNATPLLAYRSRQCESPWEKLFLLMTLGDDRVVAETYVNGARVYERRQYR